MLKLFNKFRFYIPIIILSLLISSIFIAHNSRIFELKFIHQLENFLYDTRLVLTIPDTIDPTIVIVDIDEKSLAEIGRWPWSRDKLAVLVSKLFNDYGVFIIGFDIFFREYDDSSGIRILKQLGEQRLSTIPEYQEIIDTLETELDFDQQFIDSLYQGLVVLGYTFFSEQEDSALIRSGALPPPVITKQEVQGRFIPAQSYVGYGANLPEIQAAAVSAGHTTPSIDEDGVVRRVPLLIEFEGDFYESFSLAITRLILGIDKIIPVFTDQGTANSDYPEMEWLALDQVFIPVDANVQALVPFRKKNSFNYVSAVDVITGRADPETLSGSIVLIGTSAKGLFDLRATPIDSEFPGVEIHANLISGMLDQSIKMEPAYTQGIEFLQLVLSGLILSLVLPFLSPVIATLVTITIFCATVGLNLYFWASNLVVPLAATLLLISIIYLMAMSYGFFVEQRGKRQLSHLFGQYVPPELVDEMNDDPSTYTQNARNREMTVLFSDIRNFTTISEGLRPEDLSQMLNEYLTPMTQLIYDHRGTIDKYIGDAVMAFWGAPLNDRDHARHALFTGLAMIERVHAISDEFVERGWPEIRIGVGINTGTMSVGDMGSIFRMSYTVLGDAVNLGSRLEGLTKAYGVEIIVGEGTKAAVDDYVYRELDIVKVKGKEEPIPIYEPIAPWDEVSEVELEEITMNENAQKDFRSQKWDEAENQFKQLADSYPGRLLYSIYLDRIVTFRKDPPVQDWDGVYTHTSK
ncbi:MAG: adenylate/guanylate cyclase domain-containing protein [Gammaproteobacteria bacterium]|nr:adenylate/guanylate cyclase domain-containing protein [Gammaproteobacteria bacterium]